MCLLSGHHLYSVTTTPGPPVLRPSHWSIAIHAGLWLVETVRCLWPLHGVTTQLWTYLLSRVISSIIISRHQPSITEPTHPTSRNFRPSHWPKNVRPSPHWQIVTLLPALPLHQPNNSLFFSVSRQLQFAIYKILPKWSALCSRPNYWNVALDELLPVRRFYFYSTIFMLGQDLDMHEI